MNLTRNRLQSIGWAFVLTVCVALTVALTLRVNAVKGQVRQTENRIVSLQRQIRFLEVEYQTRANQQQLSALNSVEFGYVAPGAGQYIEGERQLASLGVPRAPDAPEPIRMAQAAVTETEDMAFTEMVSPMSGRPAAAAARPDAPRRESAPKVASLDPGGDLVASVIAASAGGDRAARVKLAGAAGN
jgi:hypothetical protein